IISNQLAWVKNQWNISHTTNFSQKNTSLPKSVQWTDAADQLFYHKTQAVNGNFGINLVWRDQKMESIFALAPKSRHGLLSLQPHWSKRWNDHWSIYAELPLIYEYAQGNAFKLAQKLQLAYSNESIRWTTAFSTQNIGPGGMILVDSTNDVRSRHFQTDLLFSKLGLRPSMSIFYNTVFNPVYSFDEVWGDANENLLPMNFPFMRASQGKTYGITAAIKPRLGKNAGIQLNATFFRSLVESSLDDRNFTAENGFSSSTHDLRYLASGNLYRYFDRKKGRIFISLGFITRGKSLRYIYTPTNDNTILQSNFSLQEGKVYYRFDTRISYQRKKYSISLDLQNLTSRVNDFSYGLTQDWGNQLGLIPNMTYRYNF
nr:hypothetical protein [Saprospiraceae bacterium]